MKSYKNAEMITKAELEWYFCSSDADCGIKSNWQAMVSASCFGSTSFHDPMTSFMLEKVSERRKIEKIFNQLSDRHQDILFASFSERIFNSYIFKIFRNLTGTVYCLKNTEEVETICRKSLAREISTADMIKLSHIRIEATKEYQSAIFKYCQLKELYEK